MGTAHAGLASLTDHEGTDDQQTRSATQGEAKIVTLCGSTRFEAEFAEVEQRLTLEGCVVISLGIT